MQKSFQSYKVAAVVYLQGFISISSRAPLQHLSERRRKEIASLARSKGRTKHQQMLIEGWRSVVSALDAHAPIVDLLVTPRFNQHADYSVIAAKVASQGVSLYEVSEKEARLISTTETDQGIIAVAKIDPVPIEVFLSFASVVVLDGVQDPGNVGTIIRTAAWFGIEGVIGARGTADFYNPKVIRSSMGGIWDVSLSRVEDIASVLRKLQDKGSKIVAADLQGKPLQDWRPEQRVALVIGGEAHGISDEVHVLIDESVTIPGGKGAGVESLNAGLAAGIIMHHWAGHRPL